jgi:hypothetical protein
MGLFNLEKGKDGLDILRLNNGQKIIGFHTRKRCLGDCPIHYPTVHKMSRWELYWRQDLFIFERMCPKHGVGHPDPDSITHVKNNSGVDKAFSIGIHGCCGCCVGMGDK